MYISPTLDNVVPEKFIGIPLEPVLILLVNNRPRIEASPMTDRDVILDSCFELKLNTDPNGVSNEFVITEPFTVALVAMFIDCIFDSWFAPMSNAPVDTVPNCLAMSFPSVVEISPNTVILLTLLSLLPEQSNSFSILFGCVAILSTAMSPDVRYPPGTIATWDVYILHAISEALLPCKTRLLAYTLHPYTPNADTTLPPVMLP